MASPEPGFVVRAARADDAAAIAAVHVASWREAYRGTLVPDEVLDAPDFVARRERFWRSALKDPRWAANRIAVSEHDGVLTGVAMSGPAGTGAVDAGTGQSAQLEMHLHVLYLLAEYHGGGSGAALLDAVTSLEERTTLWVGEPNPRAQAFYRKQGFRADGTERVDDGIREILMRRDTQLT